MKGSHIVLPRLYEGEHAFILQNDDRRVVFMIPFEDRFTLVGTTDVDYDGDPAAARRASRRQLPVPALGRYLARPRRLPRHCGAMPACGRFTTTDPADPRRSRDYTLRVDDEAGTAPVLSVFGGKITTYRRLAEHALEKLAPYFPALKPAWTRSARFRAVISRAARRQSASSLSDTAECRRASCRRLPAPRRGRGRGAGRRAAWRGLWRGTYRARGGAFHGARMGVLGRRRALAAHQVRPAHDGEARALAAQVVGR